MAEEKVVQTRMEESLYNRFRQVAEEEAFSLKEALKEAAAEFVERHGKNDPEDPFFKASGGGEDGGDGLSAKETESYLYTSSE